MRIKLPFESTALLVFLASISFVLATARLTFDLKCINLCTALIPDLAVNASCQRLCDAIQAQEGDPCIQALINSTDEDLILLSYSSGHYMETAEIREGAAREANPEYLRFIQHNMRLNDRGSPEACHSMDSMQYCFVQDELTSLGLCLPVICGSASITEVLANLSITSSDPADDTFGNDERSKNATTASEQASFVVVCGDESRLDADAGTALALAFVFFLSALTLVGTFLDYRQKARVAPRLQEHSVFSDNKFAVDAYPTCEQHRHVVRLGTENVAGVSERGADQHDVSVLPTGLLQAMPLLTKGETRTEEQGSANMTVGDTRTISRHGACATVASKDGGTRDPLLDSSASKQPHSVEETREGDPSWCIQCLACFSLRKNVVKLLAPPSSSNLFGALDGIRTLSNLWVVLLHLYTGIVFAPGAGVTNVADVFPFDGHGALASVPAQIIQRGELAVDTFLLLSGFLASVTLLPLIPRVQSGSAKVCSWVLGRYWHRYLRLMPTTAFLTLVSWQLYPLASDGPTWWPYASALKESCRRDWWTEIMFVQNLVHWSIHKVPCMLVAWTLGLEMQLFLGAVPLIVLFHSRPRMSVVTLLSIMAAGCLYTLWFAFERDIRFPIFHLDLLDRAPFAAWEEVYVSPFCRCPVYIIGILGGMAWHTHLRERAMSSARGSEGRIAGDLLVALDRKLSLGGFIVSALLMSLPVFGAYWADRDAIRVGIPAWADHLYLAFSRPAWASGVALMCGLCFCGRGGVVNWFLTWSVWSPLSRLTFCSYLIHFPLLMWLFISRSIPIRYTTFEVMITYGGITTSSFAFSAVVHLLVEAPFRNLDSWARSRSARKA